MNKNIKQWIENTHQEKKAFDFTGCSVQSISSQDIDQIERVIHFFLLFQCIEYARALDDCQWATELGPRRKLNNLTVTIM